MMRYFFSLVVLVCLSLQAQSQTQTVRGVIVDYESKATLPGANVFIVTDTLNGPKGASTDENGKFKISSVSLGKHTVRVSYIGYQDKYIDITVISGKEVILSVELEESAITMQEVEVLAVKRGDPANEMALVSTRTFDVAETERYAGSRGDPARMASNFAGVQGADDSRNDIVVRGNSPLGVIYRLEGVDIPNPNHFSIAGSMGGPVSILNNKVLANSDFFTGAFPAEYGNSTAAVFDLKFRPGNNEKHEFSGQIGFLGLEASAEGPINKEKGSSYLGVFRYSTLSLFSAMGISIGTDAVPRYMDGSFKLNFPGKKGSNFSVFGIGGSSSIDILISEQEEPATDFYGDDDRDQYFQTRMGVLGAQWTKTLNQKTYLRVTVSGSQERQASQHDYIIRHLDANSKWVLDSIYPLQRYAFVINRASQSVTLNTKINRNHAIRYGVLNEVMFYDFLDSALNYDHTGFNRRWDYSGSGILTQAFIQWKWKPNELWTITSGWHAQYFSVSNSLSAIEPRVGAKRQLTEKSALSFGLGMHSQTQPYYTYFYRLPGNDRPHNETMDFTKSTQAVLGYDQAFSGNMRLKVETYYQQLNNVPVELGPSAFSLSNMGSGFARFFPDTLVNTGTGQGYGIEFTLEKFFNKSFFFLITGSLFDAKYKGSDNIERNTDYNGQYAANFLAGKEFKTGDRSSVSVGTKFTTAGGRWYGFADTAASNYQRELVFLDSAYNTMQFRPYYRLDLKVNYKFNAKKVTHEIALDLVNVLGIQNILGLSYSPNPLDPGANPIRENYQLGFLPLFYYRVDF